MNGFPVLTPGLGSIAGEYDALICDVWGVVHDGVAAYPRAVEALTRFRKERGPVVLLSNAPRPPDGVAAILDKMGVSREAYDAIVTSGGAARRELIAQAQGKILKLHHIGPERDNPVYDGLDVALVGPDQAEIVLCTGLFDDDNETPADYAESLAVLREQGLTMICANPDMFAPRGGKLVHCAGGIAKAYENIGGDVIYYGKPKPPIYGDVLKYFSPESRVLVVGDALETDIAGANTMSLDALFVAHGLHKDELVDLTDAALAKLFGHHGLKARAALDILKW
ncbi:HAD superfamily hydrolase (TIGR01459 family) [Rhizomicrobium palustre]|uniref:HAD superfamily hydrolase (TIGR01459 family) n=1 Tax=Rhizomicrobium palustre TaxID=189966 RepID=A0A846MZH1_9PROT|nr:TIGR01459 family HAD-type hydrolase [Rhizomicrobium palustre]NIK89064.1 HAD superfamily hydrolase (TIGR01459 family) [Rhizomicrobium palustre]